MRLVAATALAISLLAANTAGESRADAAEPEKRPLPDYDGRGAKPTTVGDVLIWGPRVVAAPLWLTSEFILRRPLGWVVTTAERNNWPTKVLDFFSFDKERKSGILPTAYYEFGFRPSVGAYFFWDDAGWKNNAVRATASTWGADWLSLAIADRIGSDDLRSSFTTRAAFAQRPDGLFAGIGPRSKESEIGRYGFFRMELAAIFDTILWRASTFQAQVGVRSMSFQDDQRCCSERAIRETPLERPPGFDEGYTSLFQRMELALDTRQPPPASLTGFRVMGEVEHGADVRDARGRQWLRYGGQIGGFVDVGRARVIGLVLSAAFADPLGDHQVPFTEQVILGGLGAMRGYRPGRLTDRSALVATLQYSWPIWVWLDGSYHVAMGNVWGTRLNELDPKLLRLSTGIGFRTVGSPDHVLEFLVGLGTETIENGLAATSIRVLFGGTRGF